MKVLNFKIIWILPVLLMMMAVSTLFFHSDLVSDHSAACRNFTSYLQVSDNDLPNGIPQNERSLKPGFNGLLPISTISMRKDESGRNLRCRSGTAEFAAEFENIIAVYGSKKSKIYFFTGNFLCWVTTSIPTRAGPASV